MKKVKITITGTLFVPDKLQVDGEGGSINHRYWESEYAQEKALAYYEPIIAFQGFNVPQDLVEQYDETEGVFELPKLPANQGVPRWAMPTKWGGNPFEIKMEEA